MADFNVEESLFYIHKYLLPIFSNSLSKDFWFFFFCEFSEINSQIFSWLFLAKIDFRYCFQWNQNSPLLQSFMDGKYHTMDRARFDKLKRPLDWSIFENAKNYIFTRFFYLTLLTWCKLFTVAHGKGRLIWSHLLEPQKFFPPFSFIDISPSKINCFLNFIFVFEETFSPLSYIKIYSLYGREQLHCAQKIFQFP